MRGGPSHTSSLACADWLVDDSVVPSTGFETATTSTMGDVALHRSLRRFLVCWLRELVCFTDCLRSTAASIAAR
jgi:hypothetical protein